MYSAAKKKSVRLTSELRLKIPVSIVSSLCKCSHTYFNGNIFGLVRCILSVELSVGRFLQICLFS